MSEPFDLKGKRVWVAGHRGMAGSAIVRRLASEHCDVIVAGRDEVDLRRQALAQGMSEHEFHAKALKLGSMPMDMLTHEVLNH